MKRRCTWVFPKYLVAVSAAFALMAIPACAPQGGNTGPTEVSVSLEEFKVTPSAASAPAGEVTFKVKNNGTVQHEFLVIKTDLAPDALPTEANGSYAENGAGTQLIDELEEFEPGESQELALTLAAGKYVLICNMVFVDGEGVENAHYALGMRTAFTVN
jgi:uncharacterized cupredoxin-like copper-binding protein